MEIVIKEIDSSFKKGDLTTRGIFYQSEYLTPLSYTERQFSVYFCEDIIPCNDRVKPKKIEVFLKDEIGKLIECDEDLSHLAFKKKLKGEDLKQGVDFEISYGIKGREWVCQAIIKK